MASDAADAGIDAKGIQTIGGWKTARMAAYYAEQADRKRRNAAAMQQFNVYTPNVGRKRANAKRAGFKVVK